VARGPSPTDTLGHVRDRAPGGASDLIAQAASWYAPGSKPSNFRARAEWRSECLSELASLDRRGAFAECPSTRPARASAGIPLTCHLRDPRQIVAPSTAAPKARRHAQREAPDVADPSADRERLTLGIPELKTHDGSRTPRPSAGWLATAVRPPYNLSLKLTRRPGRLTGDPRSAWAALAA
jgi:hypothetical protein